MENLIDYLVAVDDALINLFGLDLSFYPVHTDVVYGAWKDDWTPEQFAAWHGKNEGARLFSEPLSPDDYLKLYVAMTLRD